VWLASMHPSEQDGITILEAVAKAYAAGQPISWPDFHRGPHGRLIELPGYSFDRKPYWLPNSAVPVTADPVPDGSPEVAPLTTSGDGERRAAITDLIREMVAAVLEFADVSDVAADVDFTDLGVDSLLAVKLRKALCASLPVSFPTPEIFNNPSPRKLAQFLDEQLEKVG
ncbi:MAG TPA: phosphopantetheine-binding protein, partial [Amycolatopsis sp.]|nr:phosphopantetheine-binding protein [Amycolatopsis sp.]